MPARAATADFPLHALRIGPVAQRQPATSFPFRRRFPSGSGVDPSGGGATAFEEVIGAAPTTTGTVVEGDVTRRSFVPGTGGGADTEISARTAHVRVDSSTCEVTLPYRFFFEQQPTAASAEFCQNPPSATAVDALEPAEVTRIGDAYVAGVNAGLADWFTVRLAGCEHDCAGRDLVIRPAAERVTSAAAADQTIRIVPRGGRGNAGTICAGSFDTGFTGHEGGHQLLGVGDEYLESDPALIARNPSWGRRERVRTDFSIMNESDSRFSVFHERHFRHVPAFLEAAFPGCTASLRQTTRSLPTEYRLTVAVGYASTSFGRAGYLDLGFDFGLTDDRLRRVTAYLGPHVRLLSVADDTQRLALLAGVRLGLERRWASSAGGPRVGGFVEGGALSGLSGFGPGVPTVPYAEAGLTAGWSIGVPGLNLGAEIAAGAAEPLRTTVPRTTDPAPTWLRFGLTLGGSF